MTLTRTTWTLLALALLCLGSGCGEGTDGRAADPAETTSAEPDPTPPPEPLPTLTPPSRLPKQPTDVFRRTTVVGVVVEAPAGCVEIESKVGVRWSLLGPLVEGLQVGERVTVTGRSRPGSSGSACTGAPFVVDEVG